METRGPFLILFIFLVKTYQRNGTPISRPWNAIEETSKSLACRPAAPSSSPVASDLSDPAGHASSRVPLVLVVVDGSHLLLCIFLPTKFPRRSFSSIQPHPAAAIMAHGGGARPAAGRPAVLLHKTQKKTTPRAYANICE
ncbi:hypothetical protein GUJ93_ZPchr0013g34698 [Zizania palustris]|uniref:Secreted protein n=1 Tax=Zizania palustris TaxID=103762 RepID=A0A8J5WV97_ZIZPA|nr:hypothetical protein GUJ93_ZPchr0013g34698 [Zizania palustris]